MTNSRKGRLALLISVALHGIGIGMFAWLAHGKTAKVAQTDLVQFVQTPEEPSMTTFVMRERTEVMELGPKSNPVLPKPLSEHKTVNTEPSGPPKPPGSFPEAVRGQASRVDNAGMSSAGQGTPNGPGGSIATTTFFDVPAKGQKIVYLIDHSASMGPSGALEVAGQELLASLGQLSAGTNFQVIVYNRTANLLMPRYPDWIPGLADAVKQVAAAWTTLPAEGGTDHVRALKLALSRQADVIFFLTDAGDVHPDLLRDITRLNHGRTAIHVIELNAGHGQHDNGPLQLLARENRGTFQSVLVR